MPQALVDAIGATGAVLTTVCWVPQAVKIIRDRETRAISLPGTMLCVLGVLLWLVYGLAIVDGPLIGSSLVTFAMTATILALKIRHGLTARYVSTRTGSPSRKARISSTMPAKKAR